MSGFASDRGLERGRGAVGSGDRRGDANRCVECGILASLNAWSWRCYRDLNAAADDQSAPEPFYCSTCAERGLAADR